jgi:cell division transport system permease protein
MQSLWRIVVYGFQDVARNLSLSLMTVLILILMLLSINTLVFLRVLAMKATETVEKRIDVSIFVRPEVPEASVKELEKYVAAFPSVVSVVYKNSDEVLRDFREKHKDSPDILASLDELGANPLGSTIRVQTRRPEDYKTIIDALRVPEYEHVVEAKTFGDTERAINRINAIVREVERFSIALSALFAVIAFFIIFNTIRVAIYTQRAEISIKKLVGASNWFVRGPYIVEAVIFTVVSVGTSVALLAFVVRFADPYLASVFEESAILTTYAKGHILQLILGQSVAVLFLTVFSSFIAMQRHLKV